jgi:hypothetical protein
MAKRRHFWPSPKACLKALEQRERILQLGIDIDVRDFPPQRLRQLARLGKNYNPHAFRRFDEPKSYAILVASLMDYCPFKYNRTGENATV